MQIRVLQMVMGFHAVAPERIWRGVGH